VDEILVLSVCFDPAARLRSYELLAESVIQQDLASEPTDRSGRD
jgi:hypothetical protein